MQFSIDPQILAGYRRRSEAARAVTASTNTFFRDAIEKRKQILREPGVETRYAPGSGVLPIVEPVPSSLSPDQRSRLSQAEAEVARCKRERDTADAEVKALNDTANRVATYARNLS